MAELRDSVSNVQSGQVAQSPSAREQSLAASLAEIESKYWDSFYENDKMRTLLKGKQEEISHLQQQQQHHSNKKDDDKFSSPSSFSFAGSDRKVST
jgi:hypothetical protein